MGNRASSWRRSALVAQKRGADPILRSGEPMACSLLKRGVRIERLAFSSNKRGPSPGWHMFSSVVRMTVEWFVPIGQTRPITMALHTLAADTQTAHGCIGCSVTTEIGTRGTVCYTEEWLTEEDLRHRLQSDSFAQLVALIEHASQRPRIEFLLAHETRGLDFVEEVRGAAP